MDINDLMKLVNAGFTKDEIMALNGSAPTPTPTETVTVETPAVETDVKTEPIEDKKETVTESQTPPQTNVNFAPMMTDAQIEKLAQMLNRGSASIDLPQKRDLNDILGEHFKDLMLGKD